MKKIMKYLLLFIYFFFFTAILVSPGRTLAEGSPDQTETTTRKGKLGSTVGSWLVSVFRDNISAVDSDRCPSLPTCSTYSVKAIRKHGFFIGWMMTVDRLIHEGREETKVSPLVLSNGKWKIYDPVENNDFWWFPRAKADSK